MNGVFEAALEVQGFMNQQGWQFCIIGGIAVARWGRPRATQDVDISLLTNLGLEEQYVDAMLGQFSPRISDCRGFALDNRVVLISASNGVALDIALAAFPYEIQVISRATAFSFAADTSLVTASAEDLVVLKSFAGRERDWSDVEGILIRQRGQIDKDYIFAELSSLCELKDDQSAVIRLRQLDEAI